MLSRSIDGFVKKLVLCYSQELEQKQQDLDALTTRIQNLEDVSDDALRWLTLF